MNNQAKAMIANNVATARFNLKYCNHINKVFVKNNILNY